MDATAYTHEHTTIEATITRACQVHDACGLDCPDRVVESLGILAEGDRDL